ncbi:MAG: hypothetical protein AAF320_02545 [Myxococcota bacterium]
MWHQMQNVRNSMMRWVLRRGILTACYMFALSSCRGKDDDLSSSQVSLGELVFQLIENNVDDPYKLAVVRQDQGPLIASVDYVAGNSTPKSAPTLSVFRVQEQHATLHGDTTHVVRGGGTPPSWAKNSFLPDDEVITVSRFVEPKSDVSSPSEDALLPTPEKRIEQVMKIVSQGDAERLVKSLSRILKTLKGKGLKPLRRRFKFLDDYLTRMEVEKLHRSLQGLIDAVQTIQESKHWSQAVSSLSASMEKMLPASDEAGDDMANLRHRSLKFVQRSEVGPAINHLFANGEQYISSIAPEDLDLLEQMELELDTLQKLIRGLSPTQLKDLLTLASHAFGFDAGYQGNWRVWKQVFVGVRKTKEYGAFLKDLPKFLPDALGKACANSTEQQMLWDRFMQLAAVFIDNLPQGSAEESQGETELSVQEQVERATTALRSVSHVVGGTQDAAKVLVQLQDSEFRIVLQITDWAMKSGQFSGTADPIKTLQLFGEVRSLPVYKDMLVLLPKLFKHLSRLPAGRDVLVVERLLQAAMSFQQNSDSRQASGKTIVQQLNDAQEVVTLLLRFKREDYDFVLGFVSEIYQEHWDALLQTLMVRVNKGGLKQVQVSPAEILDVLRHVLTLRPLYEMVKGPVLQYLYCQHNTCPDKSQQRWKTFKKVVVWLWPILISEGADRKAEREAVFALLALSPDAKLFQQLYGDDLAAPSALRQALKDAAEGVDVSQFSLGEVQDVFRVIRDTIKVGGSLGIDLENLDDPLKELDKCLLTENCERMGRRWTLLNPKRSDILVDILENGQVTNSTSGLRLPESVLKPLVNYMMGDFKGKFKLVFSQDINTKNVERRSFKKLIDTGIAHHVYTILWEHFEQKAREKRLEDPFFAAMKKYCVDIYDWLWPEVITNKSGVKLAAVDLIDASELAELEPLSEDSPWLLLSKKQDWQLLFEVGSMVLQDMQRDEESLIRVAFDLYQEFSKDSHNAHRYDWGVWHKLRQQKGSGVVGTTLLAAAMDSEQKSLATWLRTWLRVLAVDEDPEGILEKALTRFSEMLDSEGLRENLKVIRKIFPPKEPPSFTPVMDIPPLYHQDDFGSQSTVVH